MAARMASKDDSLEISQMLSFIPELGKIFNVKEKVGEGTFSKVYRAQVKVPSASGREYALKYLVPTSRPSRIASELLCLKEVGGSCNVVGVELCLMNKGHCVIVMSYFPHQRFVDYVKYLTTEEIREYMYNLFVALEKIHFHGIIHRDIKPNNFLCDRVNKQYALVDFGLAQRVHSQNMSLCLSNNLQPFKDHNSISSRDRQNRSDTIEPSECLDAAAKLVAVPKHTYPNSQHLQPKKRALDFDQENNEKPSKKKKLSDVPESDASRPMSSKTGILPTPPHTPTSRGTQFVEAKKSKSVAKPEPTKKCKQTRVKQCPCYGKSVVCKLCLGRTPEEAPRGGTPGFRAPEVLLKQQEQSTAVDMWSAGVILLSMLSKKYPFFRAEDDLSSLAEMVLLVGQEEMMNAATSIGKSVVFNLPGFAEVTKMRKELTPAMYLKRLCSMYALSICSDEAPQSESLSPGSSSMKSLHNHQMIPDSAYDLLNRLLDPNPETRITAADALKHPFIIGSG